MAKEILAALVQLDADNDAHWTTDGSPRLEVLDALVGRNVRRADVTVAAPLFRRSNMVLPEEVHGAPTVAEPAAPLKEVKDDGEEALRSGDEGQAALEASDEGEAEGSLSPEDRALAEAKAALAGAQASAHAAQRAVDAAQLVVDEKLLEAERARSVPHAGQHEISRYLASQQAVREDRAARAIALRGAGLTMAMMQTRSAIDAAMARKRGHGLARPAR